MDTATALGSPMSIWWDGHEYKFGTLSEGVKADYVAWHKSYALKELYASKTLLTDEKGQPDSAKWKAAHDEIWHMVTAMQYEWGGAISMASLQGLRGMVKVAELLMKESGEPVPEPWEVEAFVQVKAEEFGNLLNLLMEESAPKSRAAVLAKHQKVKAATAPAPAAS